MSLFGRKYPWSKWRKHVALWKLEQLRPHLPESAELTESSLYDFMERYPDLYVKPVFGGGGKGVIRLVREEELVQIKTVSARFVRPIEDVWCELHRLTKPKRYLVQQGIDLLTIDGRPADFRVLLLKRNRQWTYMGTMGKLAVKGQIVTNRCRGGSALTLAEALRDGLEQQEDAAEDMERRLRELALQIADGLEARFPLITELGLDMGIDKQGHIWLIEANTRPQYKLFKHHPDPKLYRKIEMTIRALRS